MRKKLLEGSIELPSYDKFITSIGRHYAELSNRMFVALWRAYLKNKGAINLVYWSDKFDNAKIFNIKL